ncbi:MAG: zinc-ribbon domain-containing protein, partial [Candidatus Aenigmarchaeota archaeon]|nr:zinc-ribbon domain-containing protein [Candidatus Aenigmarchaeota archaeon]
FQTGAAAPTTMVICPQCNSTIVATSRFCPNCGNELRKTPATTGVKSCKNCNQVVSPTSKFCPNCGKKQE